MTQHRRRHCRARALRLARLLDAAIGSAMVLGTIAVALWWITAKALPV